MKELVGFTGFNRVSDGVPVVEDCSDTVLTLILADDLTLELDTAGDDGNQCVRVEVEKLIVGFFDVPS